MATSADRSVSLSTAALGARYAAGTNRQVAAWLLACCALVFAIVVVGGVTRLTHSGLSITEWQPIVGTLPPLSDADWDAAFSKYRQTPEYLQVNKGMTLPEFQRIFWWEYFHRLLGRLIGFAFLVPFLWFLARRTIPPGHGVRLAVIFALGAAQGALGWYMVESGLVDDPRVSQFRLTAHLGLAFLIFAAMFWTALSLLAPPRTRTQVAAPSARFCPSRVPLAVFVQVLSGGMVAGIRAGLAYNTFPLMNGAWVPAGDSGARAGVEELLLQHGDCAVRSSADRMDACVRGTSAWWRIARDPRAPRAAHLGAPCCWRCLRCR